MLSTSPLVSPEMDRRFSPFRSRDSLALPGSRREDAALRGLGQLGFRQRADREPHQNRHRGEMIEDDDGGPSAKSESSRRRFIGPRVENRSRAVRGPVVPRDPENAMYCAPTECSGGHSLDSSGARSELRHSIAYSTRSKMTNGPSRRLRWAGASEAHTATWLALASPRCGLATREWRMSPRCRAAPFQIAEAVTQRKNVEQPEWDARGFRPALAFDSSCGRGKRASGMPSAGSQPCRSASLEIPAVRRASHLEKRGNGSEEHDGVRGTIA